MSIKIDTFTPVNNGAVDHLGVVALGIYTYLCSHMKVNANVKKTEVQRRFKDIGRDRFNKGWDELTKNGWLTSNKITSNGRFVGWQHTLSVGHRSLSSIRQTGNVYLMKNERNGYIKIGYTKNKPEFREKTLQSQEPEITLMKSYKGSMNDEQGVHEILADKRVRGEWFDLNEEDLLTIENYFKVS